MRTALVACSVTLAVTACAPVTHIPDPWQPHMAIGWHHDYERARAQAMLEQKPILLVGASGEVDGLL